jgi:hypothetical protein
MNDTIEYLKSFSQFPFALRRFMRHPLTLTEAKRIVRERMERREENFLCLVERSIYGYKRSPYLALLKLAQCEFGDLRLLVKDKGLEGALYKLREAGVYVTFEEFKGRKPIVRQGQTIPTTARDFDNPFSRHDFTLQTGGSTGLANSVFQDLDYIAAGAPHHMLMLEAWNVLDLPMSHWMESLPGGGLRFILQRAYFRQYPEQWFTPVGWRGSAYWLKYGLATLYMISSMRLMGVRVPLPQTVKLDQADVIARWIVDRLKTHQRCLLYMNVSRALRVSVAAAQEGFDLTGATIRVGGEPITAAKVQTMQGVGLRILPAYGAIDTGSIGLGCANLAETDEVHLVKDAFALITSQHSVEGVGASVPAFNLTSLLDSNSKIMLNYQSDDYGMVSERACGCPLEAYGYTTHIHTIRSYSKLVGEGVTLIGNEMLNILEKVLPARFGGSALDYQLLEQEDDSGLTRLYLVVSPRLQLADERQVIEVVLNALRQSSPMAEAARNIWQQADTLQIKRMEPVWTSRGKLLPLHLQRLERPSQIS